MGHEQPKPEQPKSKEEGIDLEDFKPVFKYAEDAIPEVEDRIAEMEIDLEKRAERSADVTKEEELKKRSAIQKILDRFRKAA